jgi:hypothetical protein
MGAYPIEGAGRCTWREGGAFLAHVVAPLVLGSAVYVLWRDRDIRLLTWLDGAGLSHWMEAARARVGMALPRSLLGVLPDALWAYSLGAALGLVWLGGAPRSRALWIVSAGAAACLAELGQALCLVPGTFDGLDLVAMVGGCAAGALWAPRGARPHG